ncbi:type IV pilus twitching motility protein PilT [Caldinitratiruptor microaerophilus]|uniref:Twitching motility protein PilT n=1 Tax=Caldinitratiruptor microaerophilus TaxID=671077 RepID=A0AA35G8N7_9FIRM|nr:type IV pilus twitching motility protein PilT [Caldinitratiruptor microaerophilus]BDG61220.1 twitching motility protein PilT [Caldinitratiruptor microaerophilus]
MLVVDELLRLAVARGASDVHLCVEQPPVLRVNGVLEPVDAAVLRPDDLESVAEALVPPERQAAFRRHGEVDFSYSLPGTGRFRVNVYRQRGTPAIAMRLIPYTVTPLEELSLQPGVAQVLADLASRPNGLVLVAGPSGSGKSTTLAAMIDFINRTRRAHVVTLEDPIEYLHRHRLSIINQREVGSDTRSFASGLRAALRQDPDVILVGEMRDLDTMRIALEAAETGHLVLSTLHTASAPATVDRIIDVFPAQHQAQVRVQLAGVLQGVVCQRLLRRADRPGRIAACEVLVATPAVRSLIREGKTHQLLSVIQTGGRLGMRTMEASVQDLARRGIVHPDEYQEILRERDPRGGEGV